MHLSCLDSHFNSWGTGCVAVPAVLQGYTAPVPLHRRCPRLCNVSEAELRSAHAVWSAEAAQVDSAVNLLVGSFPTRSGGRRLSSIG